MVMERCYVFTPNRSFKSQTLQSESQISRELNKWYNILFSFCRNEIRELGRTDKKKRMNFQFHSFSNRT